MWPSTYTFITLTGMTVTGASLSFQSTPVMGWNSYNLMACSPNSDKIIRIINELAESGFVEAGYDFFQIDCGWAARNGLRNATTGALNVDLDAFPQGLKPLSDLARSKGMKWAMYSDAGVRMCDTQVPSPVIGSLGYEAVDADFFKSLNTEYVKCRVYSRIDANSFKLTLIQMITATLMDLLKMKMLLKAQELIFHKGL